MAEELPLHYAREAGSTDSRLHHAGLHDVACSVSHSRDITNQMQRRSATKDVARDSGRRNMQHRSKQTAYTQMHVQLATNIYKRKQ